MTKLTTMLLALLAVGLMATDGLARRGGRGNGPQGSRGATVQEYWIVAEEVDWDFAPSFPINAMTGDEFTDDQLVFVGPASNRVGHVYRKAVYREYTPGFGEEVVRGPDEAHLGILGPIIRAEVGDTIVVNFLNNTGFPVSVHPHGVLYDKASEGAPYADGTNLKHDDAVPPGEEHVYIWEVPARAGPGPNDPDSILWLYHSHTNETRDTNAGLIGPIIIYKNGRMGKVGREFVSLYTVFDENVSLYIDQNIARLDGFVGPGDEEFGESNLMHSINGLVYGNNTGYEMSRGDKVRWYLAAMGTEVDLHTPHWHGVTALRNGNRVDVAEILPASTKTYDVEIDNPGIWMFHCHVNDHIDAGMMTTFTINP